MDKNDPQASEATTTMRHVMHELRTPLTQILGYTEMLQEEVSDRGLEDLIPDLEEIRTAAVKLQGIVESLFHGGEVHAAEKPPAATSTNDPHPTVATSPAAGQASGSLLVVDDEAKIRNLMKRRLGRLGYTVSVAATGKEALREIGDGDFDLVLLDLQLQEADGLEIVHALRRLHTPIELPVIIVSAFGASEKTVAALDVGANDFVSKPIDFSVLNARITTQLALRQAALDITALSRQLEIRNVFIRRTLGRYVSDEVASSLLDDPAGLELRGEKRVVTILKTDLRGFSTLTETCDATQVVATLNRYLGTMTDIVTRNGGIVDEFQGDALIALFGAPVSQGNDAEPAVTAAVEMQRAMPELNALNTASGLPVVEMGIGIATGEAVIGNIGTETRAKYGVVGRPINLASRIESYSLGGDVLIDEATRTALGTSVEFDRSITVQPKGFSDAISIHRVAGIGELALPTKVEELTTLTSPIPLRYAVVVGEHVDDLKHEGALLALSKSGARLSAGDQLSELSNLRVEFIDQYGEPIPGEFYAKVVSASEGLIRFTTRSSALETIASRVLS